LDNFEKQIEKLKEREQKCDIQLSTWILANYQKELLFYDPWHPSEKILREITMSILRILGITTECLVMGNDFDFGELFIYGCVKKQLGITFHQPTIRNFCTAYTLWNAPLTREEFVRQYIIWNWGEDLGQ
jgi:hypothetical protein